MPALSDLKSELTSLRARVSTGQHAMLADWQPVAAGSGYVRDAGIDSERCFATRNSRAHPVVDERLNYLSSDIQLAAQGEKNPFDLDFVARNANVVGYSCVPVAVGLDRLAAELDARWAGEIGRTACRGPSGLIIARCNDRRRHVGMRRMRYFEQGSVCADAIAMLDDVARQMLAHQHKKSARLRALHW